MADVAKTFLKEDKVRPRGGGIGVGIGGLVPLVIVFVGIKVMQIAKMMSSPMQMPATTVTSAPVKEEDWAPRLTAVGAVSAVQGAILSTDLAGTVAEVKFESGGEAKKGDVLVKLVASQEEADLELARNDLARARDLAARKVISKAELDAAESKFKQKEGVVRHKEVRAPFDGDRKSTRLNSSHVSISYAVFCLKKKK